MEQGKTKQASIKKKNIKGSKCKNWVTHTHTHIVTAKKGTRNKWRH